jgi:adenine deaminase
MTVVNRYNDAPPVMCFITNFGLKRGAIASCVGHDSHNIIAVGTSDDALCKAVNAIIEAKGGICVVDEDDTNSIVDVLPLPVAGIMTNADGYAVGEAYSRIDATWLHARRTIYDAFVYGVIGNSRPKAQ